MAAAVHNGRHVQPHANQGGKPFARGSLITRSQMPMITAGSARRPATEGCATTGNNGVAARLRGLHGGKNFVEGVLATAGDDDRVAECVQGRSETAADTRAAACDENGIASGIHVVRFLLNVYYDLYSPMGSRHPKDLYLPNGEYSSHAAMAGREAFKGKDLGE